LSRDGLRLKIDNLRRNCRLQDVGAVQGRSERRWRGIAHRRSEREARLAWGGIREHDAFLGHEMRGPAGTGRGGDRQKCNLVSGMASVDSDMGCL